MAQCAAAGAFEAHLYRYCFTTPGQASLSELPSAEDGTALFWRWEPTGRWRGMAALRQVERVEAVRHEYNRHQEHVPHARCPKRCHERGACLVSIRPPATALGPSVGGRGTRNTFRPPPGQCKCDSHYSGATCARHESPFCWNGCSGRGECVDGFCVCRDGAYGPGCALGAGRPAGGGPWLGGIPAADGASEARVPAARVYVYDLPPLWLRRRAFASDADPIFNTYHVFMSALLQQNSTALADDPAQAALFLAPAFGTNMEGLREYYAHAHCRISASYPWWNASGGANHFWWSTADGGGCELNQVSRFRLGCPAALSSAGRAAEG